MASRIQINPNLRLDDHLTMADLDEDVFGDTPAIGELVEVFEPESGIVGRGWVAAVDQDERTISIVVEWGSLTIPNTRMESPAYAMPGALLWLAPASTAVTSSRHSWSGTYSMTEA